MAGAMLLEGAADVRLEQPLPVGAGEQAGVDGRFPLPVDFEDLRFFRRDAVAVQMLDQAADGVGDVGLLLRAILEDADPGLVGVGQAAVVLRLRAEDFSENAHGAPS